MSDPHTALADKLTFTCPVVNGPTKEDYRSLSKLVRLPTDFRTVSSRFGAFTIENFLLILNPFSPKLHANLLLRHEETAREFLGIRQTEAVPFGFFPEKNGLLQWGTSANADVYSWWTNSNEPDKWPCVVTNIRDPIWEVHYLSATALILAIIERRVNSLMVPVDFPECEQPVCRPA